MTQADTLEKIMQKTNAAPLQAGSAAHVRNNVGPRVISIASGKGGVGKTNLAANLGFALTKKDKRVLILDADLNLANVDVLVGLTPQFNLHHVFKGEKTLTEVMTEGPGGMQILPGSSGIMELASLTESQKLYFLEEMEEFSKKIDILIIDTAAGINDNVVYFNLAAQERIIILTPEPTSLTDAYALIKVLSGRYDVKKFRIVINQASSEKEAISVFKKLSLVCDKFLDSLSLDFLGHILSDQKLKKAVRSQRLVTEMYPEADSSKMFLSISEQLLNEEPDFTDDGNIKFFWQKIFDR
jgi:flagellar biosynthesis protein FlhG